MTYEEACEFLFGLERRGVRLGLDRITGAFREGGDPQESFLSILVAGTNGKGSVSACLASCLEKAGFRTGLFTSPHLLDFRERMRVDGRMIRPEQVADLCERLRSTIDRWELSFFEATTLMAFQWFRESGVKAAAVEVGLGGRLDATRPVRAAVTTVTTIGLDHVKILGETRREIAGEKAGILRSGVPVAVGVSVADALGVLRTRALDLGAPFHERRRCLLVDDIQETASGTRFRIKPREGAPNPTHHRLAGAGFFVQLPLAGPHQVMNAALAVLSLCLLPSSLGVSQGAIAEGLGRVRWPGRFQTVSEAPRILADVAHNPDGARTLVRILERRGERGLTLVVGMVEGKDHGRFLSTLRPVVGRVHYCTPPTERGVPAETLAEVGGAIGMAGAVHADPSSALDAAVRDAAGGTVLITGSFYTVGAAMHHLGLGAQDPLWEQDVA